MGARLLLLRHGQIKANKVGRWHGSTDSPLTWLGRRQAKRTGRYLRKHIDLEAVYCSPLQRCQATARFATHWRRLDLNILDGLKEMSIGQWEDMPFRQLVDQHDFITRSLQDLHYAAPGGESLAQVAARVTDALRQIDAAHRDDETVLIVSHGVALGVALGVFLHDSPAEWVNYPFHNCSLTEIELTPDPLIHRFNDYAHL